MGEPKNWRFCPDMGDIVADTFIPFKVPFQWRFTIQRAIDKFNDKNYNVGLWIDLTNTSRYYNSKILINQYNLRYEKIFIEGHGKCPNQEQINKFITICSEYLFKNPTKKIAVHCTHGFNRTGFMICCYLSKKLNWSIIQAIKHFSECRKPGIYRKEYIDELIRLYNDKLTNKSMIIVPKTPDWAKNNPQQNYCQNRQNYNRNRDYNNNDDFIDRMNNLQI